MYRPRITFNVILASAALVARCASAPMLDRRAELHCFGGAEAMLACGAKIKLSEADMYDLELISGISDEKARSLLERREAILAAARLLERDKYRAFELAHGVGEKTAKMLASYVEPR